MRAKVLSSRIRRPAIRYFFANLPNVYSSQKLGNSGIFSERFIIGGEARLAIKTINLKDGMPRVHEALAHLEREFAIARSEKTRFLKLIHGYGSTGAGGDIRIAVQKRLAELVQSGEIRACIFGENWAKADEETWKLMQAHTELKKDEHLGKGNRGITIVVL